MAGGSGGGDVYSEGDSGQTGTEGSVNGGTAVSGGCICVNEILTHAGAGGGLKGDGTCIKTAPCVQNVCDTGGKSFQNGERGGAKAFGSDGGFGGGGGSEITAGRGGGHSGGGVQFWLGSAGHGGGGGSFASLNSWTVSTRNSHGRGYVLFQLIV